MSLKDDIKTLQAALIPDNITGDVSPKDVRDALALTLDNLSNLGSNYYGTVIPTSPAIAGVAEGATVLPLENGTYTNFNNLIISEELCVFEYSGGNWTKKPITAINDKINELDFQLLRSTDIIEDSINAGFFIDNTGNPVAMSGYSYNIYSVTDLTKKHFFSAGLGGGGISVAHFFGSGGSYLGNQHPITTPEEITNELIIFPVGTEVVKINSNSLVFETSLIFVTPINVSDELDLIDDQIEVIPELEASLARRNNIINDGTEDGFIDGSGNINTTFPGYFHNVYPVIDTTKDHFFSSKLSGGGISILHFFGSGGSYLGNQFAVTTSLIFTDEPVVLPVGTEVVKINFNDPSFDVALKYDAIINASDEIGVLNVTVQEVVNKLPDSNIEFTKRDSEFWIRSKYSDTQDLLAVYLINFLNKNVAPFKSSIGLNSLTSQQLRDSTDDHITFDSEGPFLTSNYWFINGSHGYLIPKVTSVGHDKDVTDLNSDWADTNLKEFKLIKIDGDDLYFAPKLTVDGAGVGKDSSDYTAGYNVTNLTHVSGATHTGLITADSSTDFQWHPINTDIKKKYLCDNKEITENGTYLCSEVTVVDTHDLFNPISITQWEPSIVGDRWVRSIFTHKFNGLSCTINNSIELSYTMWYEYYGGFQPMGLRTNGAYDPFIFIPKVKPATDPVKIDVDWKYPQNCGVPNQDWAKTTFEVNASDLIDVNDIPDRIIQYHQNTGDQSYLLGFAAGYSLLSSNTVNSVRKLNTSRAFGFAQDSRNKFYVRALNSGGTIGDVLPSGFMANYTMYYSYFNPSENEAKVYWYKEGLNYIVYIHAHSELTNSKINLPEFLEGRIASIVEKTSGSDLVTDTVIDGSVVVSLSNDANYIVLKF